MEERKLDALIEELKSLRVREAIVISEIEAVNKKRVERDSRKPKPGGTSNESQKKRAIELSKGDRVYVSNRIRKPSSWPNSNEGNEWTAEKERYATVTRVSKGKVYIETDNGVHTWRAPKNLEKITTL